MQKKLIAIAIAGLSSVAFAQTNVTLYGVADLTVESTKANGGPDVATGGTQGYNSSGRVSSNSSYVGLKGAEKLDNGLTALFQFETAFNADTSTVGTGRDSFIGLSSADYGTALVGRLTAPTRALGNRMEMLPGNTGVGDAVSLLGNMTNIGNTGTTGAFDTRVNNAVAYASKDWSGFNFIVAYGFGEDLNTQNKPNNTVATNNSSVYDIGLNYTTGGWDLGYTHAHYNSGSDLVAPPAAFLPTLASANNDRIGVGYNFEGGHKVTFQANKQKVDGVAAGSMDNMSYSLQGKYMVTANGGLVADYSLAKDLSTDAGDINDSGAKMFTLGWLQNLSKRTMVKVVYSRISNDTNAAYNFSSGAVGGTNAVGAGPVAGFGPGADPQSVGVGVRHSF